MSPVPEFPSECPVSDRAADDAALHGAAIAGDAAALETLLSRVGPVICRRIAARIPRRWASIIDAEDVMQVTYLEAFLRIRRFEDRGEGAFLAWLTRLAENNLHDAVRGMECAKRLSPAKRAARDGGDAYAELAALLNTTSSTPSRRAARGEARRAVDQAIGRLPKEYAAALRLYDLQGRSIEEVAEAMGRSPGAVHMLRARAHDRLREVLGSESDFFSRVA